TKAAPVTAATPATTTTTTPALPPVPAAAPTSAPAAATAIHLNGTAKAAVSDQAPPSDISAQMVAVSPAMDVELLAPRLPNRRLSQAKVRSFLEAMRAGEWLPNGQSIILDAEGRLMDGQHRVAAIAQAGQTVPVLVAIGVSRDAMPTIDQGRSRSSA